MHTLINVGARTGQLNSGKYDDCACFNLRKATRAVTQLFDGALQPIGLRGTQLGTLVAISSAGSATISRLAEWLVMDRTTLTRDLKPLEKQRLVKIVSGKDRRTRCVALTARGRETLLKALPLWEETQARIVKGLGQDRFQVLLEGLSKTVSVAHGD